MSSLVTYVTEREVIIKLWHLSYYMAVNKKKTSWEGLLYNVLRLELFNKELHIENKYRHHEDKVTKTFFELLSIYKIT